MHRTVSWIIMLAVAAVSLPFAISTAHASTGAFAGVLEKVGPPRYAGPNAPEREFKLKSFNIRSKFILYQSNTVRHTGEIVDWYQLRTDSSPALGGWLTSPNAFERALPHFEGHYMYVYEDKHFDLSPTPTFTFGLLRDADMDKGELTIDVPQTSLRFHYSENPILRVTEKVGAQTQFKVEPWKDLPRENVKRMLGRWVQVHPAREQMIWVESEAAQWDADQLATRAMNAPRGGPNSLTNNAHFLRYVPALANEYGGRYYLGMEIETRQNTEREAERVLGKGMADIEAVTLDGEHRYRLVRAGRGAEPGLGATLDARVVPGWVGQRPGRFFAANHYRRGGFPHQRYFQSMDDEIRGTIASINGDKFTIDVSNNQTEKAPDQVTVTVDRTQGAKMFHDGNLVTSPEKFEEGQLIRVFPKRDHQTVVLLDEYRPYGAGRIEASEKERVAKMGKLFRPRAYFHATDLVISKPTEITLDASHSYHPYDKAIKKVEWQFGDATKATGDKVTKTFKPDGPYHRVMVKLTVTDAAGLSDSWIEYVEITDGMMAAQKVDVSKLKPGMVADAWTSNNLKDAPVDGHGDLWRGITNWYNMSGKDVGEEPLKRYAGWFQVGESGLHEFRGAGSSGDCVLLLDGVRVIDTLATQDYGWGYQPYLQQRTRVYLEKGWHRFELYHDKRQHTLTWNGPGVVYDNPHHDIAPIYHLPAEAGDAEVRFWITGKATSVGRPLVEQDGSAPTRTGERKVIVDK